MAYFLLNIYSGYGISVLDGDDVLDFTLKFKREY